MEDERSTEGFATATYYEILGVASVASHDEVKRAYLERKLRFKQEAMTPVGPGGASALASRSAERAEFRLLEVDMAWATLRNPAARARYDDDLAARHAAAPHAGDGPFGSRALAARAADGAGATKIERGPRFPGVPSTALAPEAPVPSTGMGARTHRRTARAAPASAPTTPARLRVPVTGAGTHAPAGDAGAQIAVGGRSASIWEQRRRPEALRMHGVDVTGAAVLSPAATAPAPPANRRARWAPLIVGALVFGAVLVWGAVASRRPDPGLRIQTTQQFGPDRCLRFVDDPTIGLPVSDANGERLAQSVSCTEAHDARIVARVPFPTACPRGTPEVVATENVSVCVVPA